MPNSNATYSFAQLEALWIQAGGSRAKAPIMAAIALAESGGRVGAISPKNTDGSVDRGLWQINSIHGALSTTEPLQNAKAAVKIEGTQGLNAWTVYKSGAYKSYLKNGVAPDTSGLPTGSTPAAGDASQAGFTGDLGDAIGAGLASGFGALLQPVISLFIWGSEIVIGGGFIIVGLLLFIANSGAGKEAESLVTQGATTTLLPEGKAASIALGKNATMKSGTKQVINQRIKARDDARKAAAKKSP